MKECFIALCVFLTIAVLKFESVTVTHYVKVEIRARKLLDYLKTLFNQKQ
jgi:hypothetical protein